MPTQTMLSPLVILSRAPPATAAQGKAAAPDHQYGEQDLLADLRILAAAALITTTDIKMNQTILLKSSETAARLGISTTTLHRWVRAGKIECVQIERNAVYFTYEAIEAFVQNHRKQYKPRNIATIKV